MSFFAAFINRQFIHEPPVPTASFKERVAIVTGGNSGLGLETSRWLLRLGVHQIILAVRNIEKGNAAAKDLIESTSCSKSAVQVWQLDLNSYASVLAFADRAKRELTRLDVLLCNAGVVPIKFRKTEDNEESITTNVVSLALLSFLLHPKLRESSSQFKTQTHLTITASELYEVAKFKEQKSSNIFQALNDEKTSKMDDRYNVSKLLDILITKQLASMSPLSLNGVIINCVAPGFCQTNLGHDHPLFNNRTVQALVKVVARRPEVGARTLVYGASAGSDTHGQYLPDCKITETKGLCKGKAGSQLQERFWMELRPKLESIQPGVTTIS